jgi:hypothetical protein
MFEHLPGETDEIHEKEHAKIVVPADIRIGHFPHSRQKH